MAVLPSAGSRRVAVSCLSQLLRAASLSWCLALIFHFQSQEQSTSPPPLPQSHLSLTLNVFFIYSCVDGYLGCFHLPAIVNNATVDMGFIFVSELAFMFSSGKYLKVQLLSYMAVLFLIF